MKERTAEQLARLNTCRARRFGDAAYTLMQLRSMRNEFDRLYGCSLPEEKKLEAIRSEVIHRVQTVCGQLESMLGQHQEDPGHTSDDAAELWREMNELFYKVQEGST